MDLFSDSLAEPMLYFVKFDDDIFKHYISYSEETSCSMAEFVQRFYYDDFKQYCEDVYHIKIN